MRYSLLALLAFGLTLASTLDLAQAQGRTGQRRQAANQ
jgi:hypothetical protein